jgi:hypothetical protein
MSFGMSITQMMIWELDFELRETYLEGDWKHFFPQRPTFDSLTGGDSWIHPSDREMLAQQMARASCWWAALHSGISRELR